MKQGIRCTAVAVCDCACGRIYASSFWVVATVTGSRRRLMYSARRHDETGLQSHRSRTTAQWLAGRTVRGTATAPGHLPLYLSLTLSLNPKPTPTLYLICCCWCRSMGQTERTDRPTLDPALRAMRAASIIRGQMSATVVSGGQVCGECRRPGEQMSGHVARQWPVGRPQRSKCSHSRLLLCLCQSAERSSDGIGNVLSSIPSCPQRISTLLPPLNGGK